MSGRISPFQGIDTLFDANTMIVVGRLALIAIGGALGLAPGKAAALIGGADGPMVLYGSTLFPGLLPGGYFLYFVTGGKYNPPIGMAGVSCVPTTAKLAQKEAAKVNPGASLLPRALGANICGAITTAILCGIYTTLPAR